MVARAKERDFKYDMRKTVDLGDLQKEIPRENEKNAVDIAFFGFGIVGRRDPQGLIEDL